VQQEEEQVAKEAELDEDVGESEWEESVEEKPVWWMGSFCLQ
jgi:hypothetical protein